MYYWYLLLGGNVYLVYFFTAFQAQKAPAAQSAKKQVRFGQTSGLDSSKQRSQRVCLKDEILI